MPPTMVYHVTFQHGNLTPKGGAFWGAMVPGGTASWTNQSDGKGLYLALTRDPGLPNLTQVSNSLYVLPGHPNLPLESRLLLRLEFDLPQADSPHAGRMMEPWAVCLRIKLGDQTDSPDPFADPQINVTCQWNKTSPTPSGPRLGAPLAEHGDTQADLDPPLDYLRYRPGCLAFHDPTRFILEFAFCGKQALPGTASPGQLKRLGYAVGAGRLKIGNREDERLFSSTGLSGNFRTTDIGALGISVNSLNGAGTCRIRVRSFSIWRWE